MKNTLFLVLICAYLTSCAPLKSFKVSDSQYSELIKTINRGLTLSKSKIDQSGYKLKSGSIKIYIANNITGEAGVAFWIIEGGYKTVNEKASSITYNFTEISDAVTYIKSITKCCFNIESSTGQSNTKSVL
ncbi:hypothetical protein [Flavivirga algicola]|uniref:Lipoprotein n=1 Tax=Flavivirga algicola TaxID=2729136 RepID=A0ABX1S118_9FLAO|nr:hypothetical protein [Flavivirga algicola]NMH88255.1 hypothetical protein [Flavivirga algicola]